MNKTSISVVIYRKDKSIVNIGDTAYLYIVKLNRKKLQINGILKNNISIFNNLNYFEGLIDIETR